MICGGQPTPIRGNAFFCRPDNFIAWDEPTLMLPLFKESPLAPIFVLAPEWRHSVQQRLQVNYPNTIESELGADWSGRSMGCGRSKSRHAEQGGF